MNAHHEASEPDMEIWGKTLLKWKDSKIDDFSETDCDKIVKGLEEIASRDGGSSILMKRASWIMSNILEDFHSDEIRAKILDSVLDKIYVTKNHYHALEALFDGIRISDKQNDKLAYIALDIIRMVLLYACIRDNTLQDSKEAMFKICYNVLVRVASRNGSQTLLERMNDLSSRRSHYGKKSTIANIARLRRIVYDKFDIPQNNEMHTILKAYPNLRNISGITKIGKSKPQITQFIRHITLNYVAHEDYETIYTAIAENNIRLHCWNAIVYRQHGIQQNPILVDNAAESILQRPDLEWVNILVGVRYIILELDSFQDMQKLIDKKITTRLEEGDYTKLNEIIDGHEKNIRMDKERA